MELTGEINRLQEMLDFSADDTDQANRCFTLWRDSGKREYFDKTQVWAYIWIRRYFLRKLVSRQIVSVTDTERLIEMCYIQFYKNHASVKDPCRFASWISIICKNRLLSYFDSPGKKQTTISVIPEDDEQAAFHYIDDITDEISSSRLTGNFLSAISAVVTDVQYDIIKRRLIDDQSYREIADSMGITVRTVRNYFSSGIRLARESAKVRQLFDRMEDYYTK